MKETFSSLLVQKVWLKTLPQNTFLPFWTGTKHWQKFRLRPDYPVKSGRNFIKNSGKSGSSRILKTLIRYIPIEMIKTTTHGWSLMVIGFYGYCNIQWTRKGSLTIYFLLLYYVKQSSSETHVVSKEDDLRLLSLIIELIIEG